MNRTDVILLLEEYNKLLMEEGYADTDILGESQNDSAIDKFLKTQWAKKNVPLKEQSIYGSLAEVACRRNVKIYTSKR